MPRPPADLGYGSRKWGAAVRCPVPITASQKAAVGGLLLQAESDVDTADHHHDDGAADERPVCRRICFLCLVAAGSVGGQYAYNLIGATAPVLHRAPLDISESRIGWLFCAYSLPNTIMPLFGGIINDRLGVRVASALFSAMVLVGSVVCSLAVSIDGLEDRFVVLTVGMAIFGIGSESLSVAQKAMLSSWFAESKEFPQLSFAVGCTLTFGYSGAVACRWVAPRMADPCSPSRMIAVSTASCWLLSVDLSVPLCVPPTPTPPSPPSLFLAPSLTHAHTGHRTLLS